MMIEMIDFEKMNGLVPATIQDADDGTVLMTGFMNRDALRQTLEQSQVVFWSRSKQRLWKKGETSGNILDVVSIEADCDCDALLVKVRPRGPVCHTGERSCFKQSAQTDPLSVLRKLIGIVQKRRKEMPEKSYTTELFNRGLPYIAQKVGEEAVELAIAAQHPDRQRCIEEAADLVYHTVVLLEEKGIGIDPVLRELERRMKK